MNFIKKVKVALNNLPKWLVLPQVTSNNKQTVEFNNGSQIKAIPTSDDAGRSEALSLLIVDEAAFVRNFDELWMGLYPTISTGGRAIVLSTPNGVGGQYHELYIRAEEGENEFNPIKLPWWVHPEHDEAWFEQESKSFSHKQVAQEFLCDFAASGNTFLSAEDLEYIRMSVANPLEKWGPDMGVWVWKYGLSEHKYIISADVARGDASDYSTFHVIDTNESEVVAEYKGKVPPDQFAILLCEAGRRYNDAILCPENNTYGYAVVMKLQELKYKNLYFKNSKDKFINLYGQENNLHKIGFTTTGQSRNQILTKLEEVIRNKQVKIYSSRLYEELKTFIWRGSKAQAQKGKNDDLVMSLAIGVWLYDTTPVYHKQSADLNRAMLEAMRVNEQKDTAGTPNPWAMNRGDPFKPIITTDQHYMSGSIEHPLYGDLSWLV